MAGIIERPIGDDEFAIYLPTRHSLPLQEVFRFYRDLEKHLRRRENFGPAFALRLTEYKAGSSEGRFRPELRGERKQSVRARQLAREEEMLRKAERQTIAAEQSAAANQESTKWTKKTYEVTRTGVAAAIAAAAITSGAVLLPQSDDPQAPPICEVTISTSHVQNTYTVPAPRTRASPPVVSAPRSQKVRLDFDMLAGNEETAFYRAATDGEIIRITGRLNQYGGVLLTDFGNELRLFASPNNRNLGTGRQVFEVIIQSDHEGALIGKIIRAQPLDNY